MTHILLGRLIFLVDSGYLDEPSDNIYPLYDPERPYEEVGRMTGSYLQKAAYQIPPCYVDYYKNKIANCMDKTYNDIQIKIVLRLKTHSLNYISYVIGPMIMSESLSAQGGQYFAYVTKDGKDVLYAGDTMLELEQNIKHDISACHTNVLIIHDKYFEDALNKLLEMHKLNDNCQTNYYLSEFKDPASTLPEPGEEENCHGLHCEWCEEMGLDGKHGNYWGRDGNVYEDPKVLTTHSHYGRVKKDCN